MEAHQADYESATPDFTPAPGAQHPEQTSADLRGEELGVDRETFQKLVATETLVHFAKEYGRAKALGIAGDEKVRLLAELIRNGVDTAIASYGTDQTQLLNLYSNCKVIADNARLEVVQDELSFLSTKIGLSLGRERSDTSLEQLKLARSLVLERQADLFERYPNLQQHVDRIQDDFEQVGIRKRIEAEKAAIAIYRALVSPLKNLEGVCSTLRGLSKEDLNLVEESYFQRYGDKLVPLLERSFKGLKLDRVKHLLAGDPLAADADSAHLAFKSRHAAAKEILTNLFASNTGPENVAAAAIFNKHHARSFRGRTFNGLLESKFEGLDLECLKALYSGNRALADAIGVEQELRRGKKHVQTIYRSLEKIGTEDLPEVRLAYRRQFGIELDVRVEKSMENGPQKDRALSFLKGDIVGAYAALLRCRVQGHKGDWIGGPFEKGTAETRAAIIKTYETRYEADFWEDLSKVLRKNDFKLMKTFVTNGEIAPAELLYHCMAGPGADEKGIIKILDGCTKEEIAAICEDYSRRYTRRGQPRDLLKDIKGEVSGDDRFDILAQMKGLPESSDELFLRHSERHRFERSGSLIRRVDLLTKEGAVMDRDFALFKKFYDEKIAGRTPSREEIKQFKALGDILEIDFESFRNIKVWAANFAANMVAGSVAGALAFTALQLGVPLLAIVMGAGAVSMATRALLKANIKGGSYGRDEMIRDTLLAAIDGGTLFMGKMLGTALIQKGINMATKFGLKQAVNLTQYIGRRRTACDFIPANDVAPGTTGTITEVLQHEMKGLAPAPIWPGSADAAFESAWSKVREGVSRQPTSQSISN